MTETKRKGSKSTKDIPKGIMEQLNRGEIESANLVEWLAVDKRIRHIKGKSRLGIGHFRAAEVRSC